MTREEAVKMLQVTRLMLMDGANQPISDLYYALGMAIEALEQTENNSEKPNNCETCIWSVCNYNKVPWGEEDEPKDEPQTKTSTNSEKVQLKGQLTDEPQRDCPWK